MPDDLTPTVVIDTREPEVGSWEEYFETPVVRMTLSTGDFSLVACESMVAVERKTVDDLVSCFCGSRERFVRELQRFQAIPARWIICEGSYEALLRGDYHSRMNPKSAWESAVALMTRYRIPLLMAGDTRTAAHLCQSLLLRWFREHQRVLNEARKAAKRLERQAVSTASGNATPGRSASVQAG